MKKDELHDIVKQGNPYITPFEEGYLADINGTQSLIFRIHASLVLQGKMKKSPLFPDIGYGQLVMTSIKYLTNETNIA